jgi:hypothetical protein
MSPTNGHANDPTNSPTNAVQQFAPPPSDTNIPTALTTTAEKIKELIANLEVPFYPSVIEWRVTNTSKGGRRAGVCVAQESLATSGLSLHAKACF